MAISFNVYNSSWAAVSGQYFDIDAVASKTSGANKDIITITVTVKHRRTDGSTSYYKESSGVLGKCTINNEIVQYKTSNVKYTGNGSNGDLTGYTSLFGNAANTTQSAHISPAATDSYNNNGLAEFWAGTTYTTIFTKEIEKTSSNQSIPWEVRFVPSEDGYNKQSLNNSNWIISGTVSVGALEANEQKVSIVVNGSLVTGVPYVYVNGTYIKGKAYVKTSSGYKPAKNP